MSQQTINVGASPNDGTGTPLRTAFQYTNSNFSELYTALGGGSGLPGATTQVIFNDGGTNLAGDAGLVYNKTTDALTIGGNVQAASGTITGDLTVDTSTLKVDSALDRVGVGTASLASYTNANLVIYGAANGIVAIGNSTANTNFQKNGTDFFINTNVTGAGSNAGSFVIRHGSSYSEQFRIDSSGNVGIGVTPSHRLDVQTTAGRFKVEPYGGASIKLSSSAAFGYVATTGNSHQFFIDTNQAMTLDASGNLLVGTTSSVGGRATFVGPSNAYGVVHIQSTTVADTSNPGAIIQKYANDTTTSQILQRYLVNNGATSQGQINANGASQAAFGSYSDSRLKENIVSLSSQLANIVSLRPVEFDYKDGSGHQIGFVAQEMQEVYSDAVGEQDGFLTVTGWSKTEARLVSAIKELAAKVQALEAKLA